MTARIRRMMMFIVTVVVALTPAVMAQQRRTQPPDSVRLYVFDCGQLNIADISVYQLKREEIATNMMSVPCFLIAHPRGNLMWDVGAVPDSAFKAGGGPPTLRAGTSTKTLQSQMAEIGYAPGDITHLAFSHFHWDHVGNANLFAGATWLVRQSERDVFRQHIGEFADEGKALMRAPDFSLFVDESGRRL